MLSAALKDRINSLPGGEFTKVWRAIEEIEAALAKAQSTGELALQYIVASHGERLAQLLVMQAARIGHLERDLQQSIADIADLAASRNKAYDDVQKLQKKLARAKKSKR